MNPPLKVFPPPEVSLPLRALRRLLRVFGIAGADDKMRENADNWLELADKVWHYRRDQLNEAERKDLLGRTDALRQAGFDHSYLGYTWLQDWYARLGYRPFHTFWMGEKKL